MVPERRKIVCGHEGGVRNVDRSIYRTL